MNCPPKSSSDDLFPPRVEIVSAWCLDSPRPGNYLSPIRCTVVPTEVVGMQTASVS